MVNRSFGRRIHSAAFEGDYGKVGTDVDDSAAALRDHDFSGCLAGKEDALDAGGHSLVVLFLSHVHGRTSTGPTGVVDQNVDAAEGFFGFVHQSADLRHVVDIG